MSVESTKAAMARYFAVGHQDLSMMAEDVIFRDMSTGQEYRGHDGVRAMLDHFYHVAFDADVKVRNMVFADQQAVGEWDFTGKHIGEFAGIPATGKWINVPLCVVYDLEDDKIKRGRVYLGTSALLAQLGVTPSPGE